MPSRRRWRSSDLEKSPKGGLCARKNGASPVSLLKGKFSGTIVGVDPSLRGTGVAVLRCKEGRAKLVFSATLKTKGEMTSALAQIAQSLHNVCRQFQPEMAAIEESVYVQNNRTAITLGSARGAALAALALNQVDCHGYAPARIKQAVVGHGRASKEQVAAMVRSLLQLEAPLPFDEADAAAAALCFIFGYRA